MSSVIWLACFVLFGTGMFIFGRIVGYSDGWTERDRQTRRLG